MEGQKRIHRSAFDEQAGYGKATFADYRMEPAGFSFMSELMKWVKRPSAGLKNMTSVISLVLGAKSFAPSGEIRADERSDVAVQIAESSAREISRADQYRIAVPTAVCGLDRQSGGSLYI